MGFSDSIVMGEPAKLPTDTQQRRRLAEELVARFDTLTDDEHRILRKLGDDAFTPLLRLTQLDALLEEYLEQLAKAEEQPRSEAAEHLLRTLRELSRPMGGKPWSDRDELHER